MDFMFLPFEIKEEYPFIRNGYTPQHRSLHMELLHMHDSARVLH